MATAAKSRPTRAPEPSLRPIREQVGAFNNMYWLELACRTQVGAMCSGAELNIPSEEVARATARLYTPGVRRTYGDLEWPAMPREMDRIDPSFRE